MNTPTPITTPPQAAAAQGFSITALVLGCVSIFMFWMYGILPVLAIIFGGIAINKQKTAGQKASGMAVAGLVLGIVFLVFAAIMWLAILGSGGS